MKSPRVYDKKMPVIEHFQKIVNLRKYIMSLHAQLSPEAQARLQAQQRNSTITSIIISILSILLVGIILLYWFLPVIENVTPDIVSYQAGADEKDKWRWRWERTCEV